MAVAVAVAVAVSGGGAVAVAVAGLTKRFFNHIQKDFLINVWGYYLEWELHGTPSNKRRQSFVSIGTRAHTFAKLLIFLVITFVNFEKKRQTLNGRLPPEDSSVFDDSVCVLIVMT